MSELSRSRRSTRISKTSRPNYNLLDLSDQQLPPHLDGSSLPTKPARRPKRIGRIIPSESTSPIIEHNNESLDDIEYCDVEVKETLVIQGGSLPKSPTSNQTEVIEVEYNSSSQISEQIQNTEAVCELIFEESEGEILSQEPLIQVSNTCPNNEVISIKSSEEIILDKVDLNLEETIQSPLPELKHIHPFFEKFKPSPKKSCSESVKPKPQEELTQISNTCSNNEVIVIKSSEEIILDKVDLTLEETIQSPLPEPKQIHRFFTQFKSSPKKSCSESVKYKPQEPLANITLKPQQSTHPFFLSPQKKKQLAESERLERVKEDGSKRLEKAKEDESKRMELIKGMNRGKVLNPFFNPTCRPKSSSPRPSTPNGSSSQVLMMDPLLPSKDHHIKHISDQIMDLVEYPPLKRRTMNSIQNSIDFNFNCSPKISEKPLQEREVFSLPEMTEWWEDIIAPINQLPSLPTSNQGTWFTKYTPNYSEELQQNFETIRLFEIWLKRWKIRKSLSEIDDELDEAFIYSSVEINQASEDDDFGSSGVRSKKSKRKPKKNTSRKKHKISAGFPESDNVPNHWTNLENVMIIEGPPRSGKTSLVHACARSMDYQVVELHPGMLRSSKGVQQSIGEISKTHFVGGNGRSNVLIFINHADLLFPNDNNFWQTLNLIATDSKRPIVITSDSNLLIPAEFKLDFQDKLKLELMELEVIICQVQYIAIRDGILLSKTDLLKICNLFERDFSKILNQMESICKLIKYQSLKEDSKVNLEIKEALVKMELDPIIIGSINLDYEGPKIDYTYISNLYETIKNDLISRYSGDEEDKYIPLDSDLDLDQYLELFDNNSEYDILKPSQAVVYEINEPETCLRSHSLTHRIEEFDPTSKLNSSSLNHCIYQSYLTNSTDFMKCNWNPSSLTIHYDIIKDIGCNLEDFETLESTTSDVDLRALRKKLNQYYSFKDTPTRMSNSYWLQNLCPYIEPIMNNAYPNKSTLGRGMRRSQLQSINLNLSSSEEFLLKSISPSYPKECPYSNIDF